ncbi:MAG: NAD(+) synthase [Oscillospiraceae bacterium]|nr:NAD(+) synthase [Oscillospiraceae bacterium]
MFDGFVKTAAATPEIKVADCEYNAKAIIDIIREAEKLRVKILVFPELCVTGYTCGDLFFQPTLLNGAENALTKIAGATRNSDMLVAVGCPIRVNGKLYNCAVVIQSGQIRGVIPKKYLPNYNEFYEMRWFAPAPEENTTELIFGEPVPFGLNLLFGFEDYPELVFAAEICEDLWAPKPPSIDLALNGATVIANLSASNETIGKDEYRESLIVGQSARIICGYVFASAGEGESTGDLVFGGHRMIAENGKILAESELYTTGLCVSEIDVKKLYSERLRNTSFEGNAESAFVQRIYLETSIEDTELTRKIEAMPFVPSEDSEKNSRCAKILAMQAHGLAKRLKHINCPCAVIGISGGLDSCLALLATAEAMKLLNRPMTDIIAVSMPCFGTTSRTKSNAQTLCEALGVTFKTVSITDAVNVHLRDIEHKDGELNIAYENAQARERTQVLMDIANEKNGIVVGTGDLSELALGWATYNGDHMSMYGVNCSVPKTLARHIVRYFMDVSENRTLKKALNDILETPVSPELLPAKNGEISQKTEDIVGPYELHDFFLYNGIRWGFSPKKVYRLAKYAFKDSYSAETILKWEKTFYKRFFSQQFKRSCLPDGVKVGSVSLSPRGDWRMPSDAQAAMWLDELNSIKA